MKLRVGHQRRFDDRWADTRKRLIEPIQYRFKCNDTTYKKVDAFVRSKFDRGYTLRHFYENGFCYAGHSDSMKMRCFITEFYNQQCESRVGKLERVYKI